MGRTAYSSANRAYPFLQEESEPSGEEMRGGGTRTPGLRFWRRAQCRLAVGLRASVSTNVSSLVRQSGAAPVRLRAVSAATLIEGTDVFARSIAAAGLEVALLSIGVSWLIWHRSSPRLKVTLRSENDADPMQTRLAVEVAGVGRLAVVVRTLGIRDHIVVRPKGSGLSTASLARCGSATVSTSWIRGRAHHTPPES
jgi:hypothetical protein